MTRALNVVLGLIVVVLIVWLGAFAVHGSVAAPGRTPAQEQAHELTEIRKAAGAEAIAFLTVDYRRMDQIIDRILDGATGTFKKQFKSSLKVLKPGVIAQEVVAKGAVREMGVGTFDGDSATVFVAGTSTARSKVTDGKVRTMPTRLRLDMTKVGKRWLVSNLEHVS